MKTETQNEINENLANGMEKLTFEQAKQRLSELGYKITDGMDCIYSRDGAEIKTVGISEIDTGLSFANVDARRDANFKALQELRQWAFAVHGKRIVYL